MAGVRVCCTYIVCQAAKRAAYSAGRCVAHQPAFFATVRKVLWQLIFPRYLEKILPKSLLPACAQRTSEQHQTALFPSSSWVARAHPAIAAGGKLPVLGALKPHVFVLPELLKLLLLCTSCLAPEGCWLTSHLNCSGVLQQIADCSLSEYVPRVTEGAQKQGWQRHRRIISPQCAARVP